MAKAVINLQKESGGIVKISPVDGIGITEVTVPESGELATKQYVDDNIGSGAIVVEANNQAEEDAAFLAGATIVIRLDLISTYDIQLLMHFDGENDGTVFTDSSKNAHTVTRLGGVVTSTTAPKIGTANMKTVQGGTDALSVADHPSLRIGTSDFTIECYFKLSSTNVAYHHFFANKGLDGQLDGWYLGLANGTNLGFFVDNGNKLLVSYDFTAKKNTSDWFHVSINRQGNDYKLYLDGELVASTTSSVTITENTGNLYIGRISYGTENHYNVQIDELVFVTNGVLRTGNFTPPTAPIS